MSTHALRVTGSLVGTRSTVPIRDRGRVDARATMHPGWMDDAACIGQTDTMFPDGLEEHGVTEARQVEVSADAIALCRSCPVLVECDRWWRAAESPGARAGVYAGLVPQTRTRVARVVRPAAS